MLAIVRDPIDPNVLEARVRGARFGAVVTFLGTVRAQSDEGRAVNGLFYEAQEAPAVRVFDAIASEARERWGACEIAIAHRVGELAIGEIAVCVAVASPHRAQAFAACAYAIDELKRRAPIWKKERYADGESEWKSNDCGPAAHPERAL